MDIRIIIALVVIFSLPPSSLRAFSPPEVTGAISLSLSPSLTANVNLKNTSASAKQFYAAGVDLEFDTNVFEISQVTCNTTEFPLVIKNQAFGNKIYLSCSKQGGQTAFSLNPQSTITLGTIQFRVKSTAPIGQTSVSFLRGVIPDASTHQDLAIQPEPATYNIPSPPTCPRLDGDADGDGDADTDDFAIWKTHFLGTTPTVGSGDLNCNGQVNLVDFEIWRKNFH